jgi:hypothetical protein
VIFLDEVDPVSSPMKAKGVAELGICGQQRSFDVAKSDPFPRSRCLSSWLSGCRNSMTMNWCSFSLPRRVPDSRDPEDGVNGNLQGLLMRELAVGGNGSIAVVNSSFKVNAASRAWLMRRVLSARKKDRE